MLDYVINKQQTVLNLFELKTSLFLLLVSFAENFLGTE